MPHLTCLKVVSGGRPELMRDWRFILTRWMAWKRSSRILFLFLLLIAALGAFSPNLATLPALSSRPHHHHSLTSTRKFEIYDDQFWTDGSPFRIIGGDLHYFRIHPQYWEDRLLRAKALGLNTIQTYVPWNLHEPKPENWVFEGAADLEAFLKLAQKLGFLVMLRPGPYICGEWDLGGFPAWLLTIEPALTLRSSDPAFLKMVDRWWGVLLPKVTPLLYNNGGPIIMVQIENEYGSYGNDKRYLQHLVTLARRYMGEETVLYTTDGGTRETLKKGTIPGVGILAAVDFSTGENPAPIFQLQKKFNAPGNSPPICTEFYTGWLTHWGEKIAETGADFTAMALETILSQNGSVVLYMAHGGTNFGFFNGANTGGTDSEYKPDLTSYDYDAPIRESGDVSNPKFRALRNVIERYSMVSFPPIPSDNERRTYGQIRLQKIASLFELLDSLCDPQEVIESELPMGMELVGQMFGFLLYVSEYQQKDTVSKLSIPKVHDRAQVFISCSGINNGMTPTFVGVIERWSNKELALPKLSCESHIKLSVLVENLGRINYGPYLYDRKGILSSVILDDSIVKRWKMFPISFSDINKLLRVNPLLQVAELNVGNGSKGPSFYKGSLIIESSNQVKDTFLSFSGWNKGIAFVNDFNIGRFWPSVGPQCNLYVPAPILRAGENVLVMLELDSPHPDLQVNFVDQPDFTCGSKMNQL